MKRRHVYPAEFREGTVKLVLEQGLSRSEAARRLSIPIEPAGDGFVAAQDRIARLRRE